MSNSQYKKSNTFSIIAEARDGNSKALEELIRRIQKDVYTMFCYLTNSKQDISDLTQDTLIRMARNIKSLKQISKFKPWLNQIVINIYNDYIKKNSKEKQITYDNEILFEIKDKIGCEPGEKCLFSEMDKLIKAAMQSLPKDLRIAILLREYEGLSYDDISEITQTTLGTVKSRIARARLKLQQELKEFI